MERAIMRCERFYAIWWRQAEPFFQYGDICSDA
jgi:hypothetical protein